MWWEISPWLVRKHTHTQNTQKNKQGILLADRQAGKINALLFIVHPTDLLGLGILVEPTFLELEGRSNI